MKRKIAAVKLFALVLLLASQVFLIYSAYQRDQEIQRIEKMYR